MNYDKLWEIALDHGGKIVLFLLGLFVTWLLSKWASYAVRHALNRAKLDLALQLFLSRLVKYFVLAAGLVSCLGIFGIQTASFAAMFAGAGLAIGMALQGTLNHFAAGLCLLILRPFRIGDLVVISGETGKIAEIDIFNTSLDTFDNRRIIIPNGEVFGSKIENITFHPIRRVDVGVGVSYGADLTRTRQVLLKSAQTVSLGLPQPPPEILVTGLGASSVDWVVRLWVNTENYYEAKDLLTENIKRTLDLEKIGIPFPQMDVHVSRDL